MGESLTLSAVYIMYQCVTLDYCFKESVEASLDLCDKVYINEGKSTDGTRDILYDMQGRYGKDRLIIIERDWKHDRAFWAEERNFLLDKIPNSDYVLNIAADECFHERDFETIRKTLSFLENKKSLQFFARHFYGTPDYVISGPAWAKVLTKVWRNDTGIRYLNRQGGCADDPMWPNGAPAHFYNCVNNRVFVYHYGHARKPVAVGIKNKKADDLYRGSDAYKDGSLPEIKEYDYRLEQFINKGGAKEFTGTHPKYMKEWVDAHKGQPTSWRSV
jgi:hypothetical protein